MDFPLGVSMTRFLHFVQPCYVPFHSSDSDSFSNLILDSVTCHHYYTSHIFSLSFHITFLLYLFTPVIRLHSILCTYRDTFHNSTDVPMTYHTTTSATSRILRFLVATFLQPVLHAGRGHKFTSWTIMYHRNSILHIPWHPLLAFENCALFVTLHCFATFVRFYNFNQIIHRNRKLVPDMLNIGSIT